MAEGPPSEDRLATATQALAEVAEDVADMRERIARVQLARANARARLIAAVAAMRAALRAALDGEPLRGLPNLNPGGEQWRGLRVHPDARHGHDVFVGERPALYVDRSGELVVAHRQGAAVAAYPVGEGDLRAEDLEPYLRAVSEALARHALGLERTEAGYARAAALGAQVARILG